MPASTVLSGATVVTVDDRRRVLTDGAIAFSDGILAVGPGADVLAEHPDAPGRVVVLDLSDLCVRPVHAPVSSLVPRAVRTPAAVSMIN